ncbi:MAG TPA: 2-hydroxyacyl-CoA dehydratase family protein [Myxococcota bacterium]|nr:2-hydroxyacyl-CoA dehydratase family protein [Myxococcota bacterium]
MSECQQEVVQVLDALAAVKDRPRGIEPFDEFFRKQLWRGQLAGTGRKLVGQVCNFVPDELVLAAGGVPIRLDDGCSATVRRGARRLQAEVCCALRALMGRVDDDDDPMAAADLLVIPTSCDGKKKLGGLLSGRHEVFNLELPQTNQGERARSAWLSEMRRLTRRIEKLCGRRVTRRSLRAAIEHVNERVALVRRMNELRKSARPPVNGADALLVMQAGFLADPDWWTEKTAVLLGELEQRAADGSGSRPRARILLTGSPVLWPDFKLPLLLLECGADIVADELCSGSERLRHPVVVDEWTTDGLIRAAGERVLLPSTCPCLVGSDGRTDRLRELVESHSVDGIVHHTQRLCQLFDLDEPGLAGSFAESGLPWLSINTEFGPEDTGRLRTRIEALLEMIVARKTD